MGAGVAGSICHDGLNPMLTRLMALPAPGTETFFLWGPRQTGKSTLLRRTYGEDRWIDLLKADEFRRYVTRPESLREELEAEPPSPRQQIVIDEIQKVPTLLDEVHSGHRCPQRRRDRELLEHRARMRRLEPHDEESLRDPRRHPPRTLASRVPKAPEAARDRGAEVLLRRRGRRESAREARRAASRLGGLRQDLRTLGLPRAQRLRRLP